MLWYGRCVALQAITERASSLQHTIILFCARIAFRGAPQWQHQQILQYIHTYYNIDGKVCARSKRYGQIVRNPALRLLARVYSMVSHHRNISGIFIFSQTILTSMADSLDGFFVDCIRRTKCRPKHCYFTAHLKIFKCVVLCECFLYCHDNDVIIWCVYMLVYRETLSGKQQISFTELTRCKDWHCVIVQDVHSSIVR